VLVERHFVKEKKMDLKATSYEAVVGGYVYKFGFVPMQDKKWVVCRQKEEQNQLGMPFEVLQYIDNELKWSDPRSMMMWMFDERIASYESEELAVADVEALASGNVPPVSVRNREIRHQVHRLKMTMMMTMMTKMKMKMMMMTMMTKMKMKMMMMIMMTKTKMNK
jgi:hypothetical protein